jgi:hypothetical protein
MPKNKRPQPRKSNPSGEDKDEAMTRSLCALALVLSEREDGAAMGPQLRQQELDFHKLVRNALSQKKDAVLYGAIERAQYEDVDAYQFLRGQIEEAASTIVFRREDAPAMEINAFVVPLFVHGTGGLKQEQGFQDQAAFEELVASFQLAQLESAKARVVLMSHAYDLDEIDRITYSHLNEMVRDAYASMTDKKLSARPALERSISGWRASAFGAQDAAVELRFLLGFALKRVDDPFYQVPEQEAAADAYFAARMERYRKWTGSAAALVKRCLAPAGATLEINFLYQDLFHGGKEQGVAELFMLQMMADMNHALRAGGIGADQAKAIVAPADVDDNMVLRVNLYGQDGALLASSEKPLDLAADLELEVDDIGDALATIGVREVAVALKFDQHGQPQDERAYGVH